MHALVSQAFLSNMNRRVSSEPAYYDADQLRGAQSIRQQPTGAGSVKPLSQSGNAPALLFIV